MAKLYSTYGSIPMYTHATLSNCNLQTTTISLMRVTLDKADRSDALMARRDGTDVSSCRRRRPRLHDEVPQCLRRSKDRDPSPQSPPPDFYSLCPLVSPCITSQRPAPGMHRQATVASSPTGCSSAPSDSHIHSIAFRPPGHFPLLTFTLP